MAVLSQNEMNSYVDVQKGSLMPFHRRLTHLYYDTNIWLFKGPASGIEFTDDLRANCLACA